MGSDKAQLRLEPDGPSLLERAVASLRTVVGDNVIVIANQPEKYKLELMIVPDNFPGSGPLAGLEAGLTVSHMNYNILVACDMPFLQAPLLQAIVNWANEGNWDAVVPLNQDGLPEPLCAVYQHRTLEVARGFLQQKRNKMADFLAAINTHYLTISDYEEFDPQLRSFKNLNTLQDYNEAVRNISNE
jgi:molybdopterin-guanine dinucleotide biosynthesis protein A